MRENWKSLYIVDESLPNVFLYNIITSVMYFQHLLLLGTVLGLILVVTNSILRVVIRRSNCVSAYAYISKVVKDKIRVVRSGDRSERSDPATTALPHTGLWFRRVGRLNNISASAILSDSRDLDRIQMDLEKIRDLFLERSYFLVWWLLHIYLFL